jgi:hypothetical protein
MRMPGWFEKSIAAFFVSMISMICVIPKTNAQGPAFNYRKCSDSMAIPAEYEGEKILAIKDWPAALLKSFKTFGICDDGVIAEEYSDAIVQSLAKRWERFPELASLMEKNPDFHSFVLSHIDPTTEPDDLNALVSNAENKCHKQFPIICQAMIAGANVAQKEQLSQLPHSFPIDRLAAYESCSIVHVNATWIIAAHSERLDAQNTRAQFLAYRFDDNKWKQVFSKAFEEAYNARPDGQVKIPHLWPGQNPPPLATVGYNLLTI